MPWIDSIKTHSAFESNSQKETGYSRNLILNHQGEIYTYQSELRYVNLRELKRTSSTNYRVFHVNKTLEMDYFDFDPIELQINDQGRYLAIAGQHKIIVCVVPLSRLGTSKMNCEYFKLTRSFQIGAGYYDHDHYNKIVKIQWHPLSQSHLLVLSSNGILRMFNVTVDVKEPEQTFHLCNMDDDMVDKKVGFGSNLDELEATSFCIGPFTGIESGWSSLTVFGLLKSGDVVSICPVLPNSSVLSFAWAQKTLETTLSEWKDSNDKLKATMFYWTQKFLEDVLVQEKDGIVVQRPLKQLAVARNGPFLYQPNTDIIDTISGYAQDIQFIPTNSNSIITIASSNGMLVTAVLAEPITPCWIVEKVFCSNKEQSDCPQVLILHQGIQLTDKESDVRLYTDLVTPDTIYCSFLHSVYQVQLGLYTVLNDITLEPTDIEHSDAVVRQLVDMGSQTISGFTTISDFTLELLYLCVSPSAGIIAEPLFPIITTPKIIIEKGNEIKLEPFDYERLNNPISIPKITKSAGYPDFIQENSIKDAMSEIESARNKIKQVISAFGDLQDRVAVLVQENKRQATLLNSKSSISLDSLKSRIKRIRKVQDGQIAKASSLLEVLFDMTQPRLSSQEIQWFQDLSVMLNVYNTKFVPELKQIQTEIKDIKIEETEEQVLGSAQVREIKNSLRNEYLDLQTLSDRMKRLQSLYDSI